MAMLPSVTHLKAFLDPLVLAYSLPRYLQTDPLVVVHGYSNPEDQEIVAFLATALAYGRVDNIIRSTRDALARFGTTPAKFARQFDPKTDARRLEGWKHRFNTARDLQLLLVGFRQILQQYGSIERYFADGYDRDVHMSVQPALESFCQRFLAMDFSAITGETELARTEGVRWFFSSPASGSACKRLNLFLRWMVRSGELDLGLWTAVSPSHLVMPVDTHIARIAAYLGLTRRMTVNFRMAEEITDNLRQLCPNDPIRYDWALCRLGILAECPKRRHPERCHRCSLFPVCQAGAAPPGVLPHD